MSDGLEALRDVNFNWVRPLESIWVDDDANVEGPNEKQIDDLVARFLRETHLSAARPFGHALVGGAGIGKTHLVGNLRRKVWQAGGWFVLLDVLGLTDFWRSAALSFLTSLMQDMPDGRRQVDAVLAGVARRFNIEEQVETALRTPNFDVRKLIDMLVDKALFRIDFANALRHRDVFRALCLLRASDGDSVSLAHGWLQGYDADEQARTALGFRAPPPEPVELVRGMSWVMSLAGPTLVAVDQIDGVVNPSSLSGADDDGAAATRALSRELTSGLMGLHDVRHRGKTVVTCLFDSWETIKEYALQSATERFLEPTVLSGLNDSTAVRNLIRNRLAPAYAAARFSPPFATWPFSDRAIASAAAVGMMPRTILMRCDAFRRACVESGTVNVCDSLADSSKPSMLPVPPVGYDAAFATARASADIDGLVTADDDGQFGDLLRRVFDIYGRHMPPSEAIDIESKADPAKKIPPLHGRLTFTFHDESDRELHYCFRALEHTHAISFQARLRAALTASGISNKISGRHLLLVRRSDVPAGPKTKALFDAFQKAGGILIDPSDEDLRTFVALRDLRDAAAAKGETDAFEAWLRSKQPLLDTQFFREAGLSPPPIEALSAPAEEHPAPETPPSQFLPRTQPSEAARKAVTHPAPLPSSLGSAKSVPPPNAPSIPVGRRMTPDEEPVHLPTKLLPRHTAIIAGSGSGKTVLLRRLVEEAALAGIPAIVIDPNNDLSRLGDAWPERPDAFTAADDEKARAYRDRVEVIVWTPGVHAGNPLFLSVMPDFSSLGDDKDERQQAVDMASETLAPLAGAKNQLQRGVLADALRRFAASGGGGLADFTALLGDLPDGVSAIGDADKLAARMADQLLAAVATNPLLRVDGAVLDPKLLFAGPDPGRVRLSVINLSGLASDAAKEDFVNRLQMTLFGWIKKNPSDTGRLYVVDEAQNFLPSQKPALSVGSGLKLVTQARKYGLGMIVATQVPRGIHNQVVSNCTTQFFGKQSAPATIGAAQEIIAASGGRADDIGKLKAGEFYFATEGSGKPAKVRTPICLTHHPANPPTPDEVIARARHSAPFASISADAGSVGPMRTRSGPREAAARSSPRGTPAS